MSAAASYRAPLPRPGLKRTPSRSGVGHHDTEALDANDAVGVR